MDKILSQNTVKVGETIKFQKNLESCKKGIGPDVTFVIVPKDKPVLPHV